MAKNAAMSSIVLSQDQPIDNSHSSADTEAEDDMRSAYDKSADSSDAMDEDVDEETHPISLSNMELAPDQTITRPHRDPEPESLIKILNLASKYHNHYAQVKSRDTADVYFLNVFIEESGSCRVEKVMMKLTNYAYPSYNERPHLATILSRGKQVILQLIRTDLRILPIFSDGRTKGSQHSKLSGCRSGRYENRIYMTEGGIPMSTKDNDELGRITDSIMANLLSCRLVKPRLMCALESTESTLSLKL
jgi:hypothetical protein